MPRTPRRALVTENGTYHLIARGNNRMQIFKSEEDYKAYLDLFHAYAKHCGVEIFHYVLMPNHIHFVVRPSRTLSAFMQVVQMTYSKRFCRLNRRVGHTWSGRYKSLPITSDSYLFAVGNYVEMNPVRAGITKTPEDWPFSSYKTYAYGKYDKLVTIDPFYPTIGRNDEERQRRYRESVDKTRMKR